MNYFYLFILTNCIFILLYSSYIIFIESKTTLNKMNKKFYLELTSIIIFLFIINIYIKYNIDIYLFYTSIIMIINIKYNYKTSYFQVIFTILLLFLYVKNYFLILLLLSYLIIKKIKHNEKLFIIFLSILLLIYYFTNKNINNLILILLYYLSLIIILYYIKLIKNRLNIIDTLKKIEDEKLFKTSIFKVTHEIKNPLAVIKGYLSIFDSNDCDKTERYKNILINEVNNALEVLKDFSEVNNLKIDRKLINIFDLLYDINNSLKGLCFQKNINIFINCEKKLFINADYNRLKQVLVNILKNSIEALDKDGNIDIKSYFLNNKLKIDIKDNGCGMDKKTLENIFVPFYTKKSYGSGMGLSLSKEIIEKHNGTIKYYSKLNSFTLVEISLPTH